MLSFVMGADLRSWCVCQTVGNLHGGCTAIPDDVAGRNGTEEDCLTPGMMFHVRGWLASIPVALINTPDTYSLLQLWL